LSNFKDKKILLVNDMGSYFSPFEHLGMKAVSDLQELKDNPDSIALVVFTGGHDVSPGLYGKNPHPRTMASARRDATEVDVFNLARGNNIPMAGICRGAQFLCVMAGGSLVQDVTNHAGGQHTINVEWPGKEGDPGVISVTSSHHQMQYPFDLPKAEYKILGWGTDTRSSHYAMDNKTVLLRAEASEQLKSEPDVIWYPTINALAAQYHPEWMDEDSGGFLYFKELVSHYLLPLIEQRYGEDDENGKEATQTTS
jgi:gamma-glutamyl-gamma-aminobutyrate hydrolase PuuD